MSGTDATLAEARQRLRGCPAAGSVWRHYKGGLYEIVCGALIEQSLEPAVIYRSQETGDVWARPLCDFFAQVCLPQSFEWVPRFRRIEAREGSQ